MIVFISKLKEIHLGFYQKTKKKRGIP